MSSPDDDLARLLIHQALIDASNREAGLQAHVPHRRSELSRNPYICGGTTGAHN